MKTNHLSNLATKLFAASALSILLSTNECISATRSKVADTKPNVVVTKIQVGTYKVFLVLCFLDSLYRGYI